MFLNCFWQFYNLSGTSLITSTGTTTYTTTDNTLLITSLGGNAFMSELLCCS
jgi:hypothetical protein